MSKLYIDINISDLEGEYHYYFCQGRNSTPKGSGWENMVSTGNWIRSDVGSFFVIGNMYRKKMIEPFTLRLTVQPDFGSLCFVFDDTEGATSLGCITKDGKCRILCDEEDVVAYRKWCDNGKKICPDSVDWRGGTYFLDDEGVLLSVLGNFETQVYNFIYRYACPDCRDTNIIRWPQDFKPILYGREV